MNPKKTSLAAVLTMALAAGATAEAAPVVYFNFSGTYTMLTPGGSPWNPMVPYGEVCPGGVYACNDAHVTGTMTMDMGAGTGSVTLSASSDSHDFVDWGLWTTHSISMNTTGPGTVHADMVLNAYDCWGTYGCSSQTIPFGWDFSMTPIDPSHYFIATIDGDGDGIPGNVMTSGGWAGFNNVFTGTATVVPIPAAAWLLGSGILGLAGTARRRRASTA